MVGARDYGPRGLTVQSRAFPIAAQSLDFEEMRRTVLYPCDCWCIGCPVAARKFKPRP